MVWQFLASVRYRVCTNTALLSKQEHEQRGKVVLGKYPHGWQGMLMGADGCVCAHGEDAWCLPVLPGCNLYLSLLYELIFKTYP